MLLLIVVESNVLEERTNVVSLVGGAGLQSVKERAGRWPFWDSSLCASLFLCRLMSTGSVWFFHEMDPSAQELAAFANLGDVVAWIGLQDVVLAALRVAMGDFQLLREVVLIPRTAWDDAVAAARVQPPGDGPPPARALRPLELGQVESIRRIARLRLGLPAAEERAADPPMAAPGAGGGGGAGAPTVAAGTAGTVALTRKFKMSSVFDQGDDSEISTWTVARMRTVMAAFKAANDGEEPEQDEEVTADQLAALEHRLNSGACPCPDFGVWRPYGHRLARQLKLTVHHITPGGDYVPYEVAGPPSFNEWLAAFRVFSVAMRALRAATATRLLIYQNKIQKLNEAYGHVCWWLVAQADQRMRSEHLERIRRRAEEERAAAIASGSTHPFDPTVPWDYCLKAAAADRHFWEEELDRKCMLYITHLKSQKQLTDAGHGAELAGDSRGGAGSSLRRLPPATRKRAYSGSDDQGGGGNSPGGRGRGRGRGSKGAKSQGRGNARMPDGRSRADGKGKEFAGLGITAKGLLRNLPECQVSRLRVVQVLQA